jgi:nucleoid-associated protein YgaU
LATLGSQRPKRRRPGEVPPWVAAAVIAGEITFVVGLGAGVLREPAPAPPAPAPVAVAARPAAAAPARRPVEGPRAAPSPAAAPERVMVRYRVQRGDSLWRIARSLTGEGGRWRELWPQHARGDGRIRPGTLLEVDPARLARPPR